jgi:uncharacterized protein (TIGR03437 family)
MPIPRVRWGGDDATSYNWRTSVKNNTGDNPWCYENYAVSPGFDSFHERNLRAGTVTLGTVSLMDWIPTGAGKCSFSVAKYGAQQSTDPDNSDCGNGILKNNQPVINDPNDAYIPVDQTWNQQWVQHMLTTYGPANAGGVRLWSLDNEPEWWDSNHRDVYKYASNGIRGASYDDMVARDVKAALTVKQADPTALITGPVPSGWMGMLFSKQDMVSGWNKSPYQYWDNPTDQKAHGGIAWIPYYLQQMKAAEAQYGRRLLDAVDVHAYITPSGLSSSAGDATMEHLRMTSTRALWDPNYLVPGGGYEDATGAEVAPQLVPRMKQWVAANYPGTLTAITEYGWGAPDTITGAIAQADILGIFGREGLDVGTLWYTPTPTQPGAFAYRIFLNYDDAGGQFGETGIAATSSDPDSLSIFAAQRSDSALTILVLNKTTNPIAASVPLMNFVPAANAQVWQYSSATLSAVVRQPDASTAGNAIPTVFPAYSMTLLVVPRAASAFGVPQPAVTAVTNAASYAAHGISPGEIAVVWGSNLGPAALAGLQFDANGLVATSLASVRVLFNGVPAPLIYASSSQTSVIVPYEVSQFQSVNVIVENQGSASAPFPVLLTPVMPAIFTNDNSGTGQGAILNASAGLTRNGPANPAARGDQVAVYATGEGITNPPGLNGRVNGVPLAKPQLNCSGTIDGIAADSNYCGEAPGGPAGFLQVNLKVPNGVRTGVAVPVSITVGTVISQTGVTMWAK